MTEAQRKLYRWWRANFDGNAKLLALATLSGGNTYDPARAVQEAERQMAALVSDDHCSQCGAREAEACAPTCGADGGRDD